MSYTKFLRNALYFSAVFNLFGALIFLFPDSVGMVAELPDPGAVFYSLFLAAIILLFGGAYFWMAQQPEINRPMLTLAGIGKIWVFLIFLYCWQIGEVPFKGFFTAIGDLIFGLIFLGGLRVRTAAR